MGKKNKGRNRGSLGEDFEDSYEYDADDGGYQDYGRKKNKRRNRDSNSDYGNYGYDEYGSDEDDDQDYDDYSHEEDGDETDDADSSSSYSSEPSYGRSDVSYTSAQNSSTVSSSVFKESKPSPLGSMHPVKATPNSSGFTPRTATPYSVEGQRSDSSRKDESSFGFKRVSVTPDAYSQKPRHESDRHLQTSERLNSTDNQDRDDESDSAPRKWGISNFFARRQNADENDSRQEEKESAREHKAREKAKKFDSQVDRTGEDSEGVSEEEQWKEIRISEIRTRLAKIDDDILDYQQFTGSDEDILEANRSIDELNKEKKELKAELRKLSGSPLAFFSGFSPAAVATSVKAVGKKFSNPFGALLRRESDGEEGDDESETSREQREALRSERKSRRREEKSRRREEKREQRERKKEIYNADHSQNTEYDRLNDESDDGADPDAPTPNGRRWAVLAHRTLGVTIVATVLLVGGYVGYMFLGHGSDKQQIVSEDQSVADKSTSGLTSILHGKYASKTSAEDSDKQVADASKTSDVSETGAIKSEKTSWWGRLKSKFSRKSDSSNMAKESDKEKNKSDKSDRKESKLATLGKSASENLKKATEVGKSKLDSFNDTLVSGADALKNDLDEVGAALSKKTDDFSDDLSQMKSSASEQLTNAVDSLNEKASDIVDSGREALNDLSASIADVNEVLDETIPAEDELYDNESAKPDVPLAVDDELLVGIPESNDEANPLSIVASESSDELATVENDGDALDVDPDEARAAFGDTPVRSSSSPVASGANASISSGDDISNEVSTTLLDESETPIGADWESPIVSNSTPQANSSSLLADSSSNASATKNSLAQNGASWDSVPPNTLDAGSSTLLNEGSSDKTPSLTNVDDVSTPSALPTLSTPTSSDDAMTLFVDDSPTAPMQLDETSDLNELSGAAPVLRDDLETWNTAPSLTSQRSAATSDNPLTTSLDRFNSRVESLADRVNEGADNLREGALSSLDQLGSSLNEGVANLQNKGQQTLNSINNSLSGVRDSLNNSVENIEQSLGSLSTSLDNARQSASDTLQNVGSNISDNFSELQRQFNNPDAIATPSGGAPLTNVTAVPSSSPTTTTSPSPTTLSLPARAVGSPSNSLVQNPSTRQNNTSLGLNHEDAPKASDRLASSSNPALNSPVTSPHLAPSQNGSTSGIDSVTTFPSQTARTGNVASDASDLMPANVDYSYSMSPLGRVSSGVRIDSSTIATPSVTGVTGVPSMSSGSGVPSNAVSGVAGTADVPTGYRQYITKEGDNLLTIADRELGSSSRWGEIKRLNNLRSGATYFEAGTRLLLPISTPGSDE